MFPMVLGYYKNWIMAVLFIDFRRLVLELRGYQRSLIWSWGPRKWEREEEEQKWECLHVFIYCVFGEIILSGVCSSMGTLLVGVGCQAHWSDPTTERPLVVRSHSLALYHSLVQHAVKNFDKKMHLLKDTHYNNRTFWSFHVNLLCPLALMHGKQFLFHQSQMLLGQHQQERAALLSMYFLFPCCLLATLNRC